MGGCCRCLLLGRYVQDPNKAESLRKIGCVKSRDRTQGCLTMPASQQRNAVRTRSLPRQPTSLITKTRHADFYFTPPIKLAFMAATMLSKSPALPTSLADAAAVARTHLWYPCSISDRRTLMLPGTTCMGGMVVRRAERREPARVRLVGEGGRETGGALLKQWNPSVFCQLAPDGQGGVLHCRMERQTAQRQQPVDTTRLSHL